MSKTIRNANMQMGSEAALLGSRNTLPEAAHGPSSCAMASYFLALRSIRANRSRTDTSPSMWHHNWGFEIIPFPVEDQTFLSTAVFSAVSFGSGMQEQHKPNGRAWWPLEKLPEEPLEEDCPSYPGTCCFTTMGFRRLQLSRCSIYTQANLT